MTLEFRVLELIKPGAVLDKAKLAFAKQDSVSSKQKRGQLLLASPAHVWWFYFLLAEPHFRLALRHVSGVTPHALSERTHEVRGGSKAGLSRQ